MISDSLPKTTHESGKIIFNSLNTQQPSARNSFFKTTITWQHHTITVTSHHHQRFLRCSTGRLRCGTHINNFEVRSTRVKKGKQHEDSITSFRSHHMTTTPSYPCWTQIPWLRQHLDRSDGSTLHLIFVVPVIASQTRTSQQNHTQPVRRHEVVHWLS